MASRLFPYVMKASDLQVHGVCLGLEVMSVILASQQTNSSVLSMYAPLFGLPLLVSLAH